ncbi:MAG: branched-chain amino acid transporter permease [Hyphomicrobiales bacterium]|nr:branched-chain amino acid transporter permease [Hyphomicrobiales bacterium]
MVGQYVIDGLLMGGLYACLAIGFSLVWGVLNIVNMLHGSMVVLGAYTCLYDVQQFGIPRYVVAPLACGALFLFGYALQRGLINRVVAQPILISLTLTFGLELIDNNLILHFFRATPRSLVTNFGTLENLGLRLPVVRVGGMLLAGLLTLLLYWLLRHSKIGTRPYRGANGSPRGRAHGHPHSPDLRTYIRNRRSDGRRGGLRHGADLSGDASHERRVSRHRPRMRLHAAAPA